MGTVNGAWLSREDATVSTAKMGEMESAGHQVKTVGITGKSPDWWPNWSGQTCAIVASGPSAKKAPVQFLWGRTRAIAINESYQLCPWADVLYGCDAAWWRWRNGVADFNGMKISQDENACSQYPYIRKVKVDKHSNELGLEIGNLGSGGNSGFQCLNLAAQFGACRILLIGFDMRVDLGEHWHPRHYPPLSNPHPQDNLPRWRRAIDGAADTLAALGITVINCSPVSLLKAYPKMTIEEALWEDQST